MRKIGLIGGMSWASTLDYYRLINQSVNDKLGGLTGAECLIYSINYADVADRPFGDAYHILKHAGLTLMQGGAEAILLCANTAHMFADQLQAELNIPLINIIDETATAVLAKRISKIGLLGTKPTMEMDFYRSKLERNGLQVLTPEPVETRDYIQQVIRDELARGQIHANSKERFLRIVEELTGRGAEGIILGCTEIPLLIGQEDVSIPVFDTTQLHAAAAVAFALGSDHEHPGR